MFWATSAANLLSRQKCSGLTDLAEQKIGLSILLSPVEGNTNMTTHAHMKQAHISK